MTSRRGSAREEVGRSCGDCGAALGQHHKPGCDCEVCPFCLGQLISCGCIYKHLNICVEPGQPGFDEKVYMGGPSKEQSRKFDGMLREKGLIPHVPSSWVCQVCGELWPDFFMAPDSEWRKVVPQEIRGDILCEACFVGLRDGDKYKPVPHCILCGSAEPLVVLADTPDFKHYVPPITVDNYGRRSMQAGPMCTPCYEQLKEAMPKGWKYE